MSQAASGRALAAKEMVRSQGSLYWICGKESDSGTGLSQNKSAFPYQYHPIIAQHQFIHFSPALHFLNNLNRQ